MYIHSDCGAKTNAELMYDRCPSEGDRGAESDSKTAQRPDKCTQLHHSGGFKMITNITKDNFENEVLKADKPVLVDFWAAWCGPCKMIAPAVEEVAKDHPEIKVCKLNIDDEPQLAMQYGVMSIPTLMVFKNGEVAQTAIGLRPKNEIEELLK